LGDEMQDNWKTKAIIFLSSQILSLFGSSVVSYAVVWYITLKTGSASLMTVSILASFLPQIVISLFAGVWADRYNRKLLIISSDLLTGVSTLVLAIYFLMGHESITLIFIISAIRSVGSGIQTPAVGAILPQIVPMEKMTRINGINSALTSVMMLLSPAVAGIFFATLGFGYTLLLDVITAALAVGILSFLKVRAYQREVKEGDESLKEGTFSELKAGLSYTKNHKLISRILIFYAVFFFMVSPAAFLTPIMIARSFGTEVWRLTANEMFWTGGAIFGGVIVAWLGEFKDKIRILAISTISFGITFILLGLSTNFIFYLGVMFASGIFLPFFSTAETVLILENVEEHMLGRVYSIVQIIISAVMPLGMLLFGPLGDVISIESILIGSGLCILLLTPFIWRTKVEAVAQVTSDSTVHK
ncbi:MAG TPA: MFS transporter, partial [Anaerovoracaceae bacterium]|nr:MFS transporter [Anaerovoracaceae bacterium]